MTQSPERATAGSPPEGQHSMFQLADSSKFEALRTRTRPGSRIALLGFAPSWKDAPFDDPSVEIFGLNELHKYVPRWDRWIEVHDEDTLGVSKRDVDGDQLRHLEWLKKDHGSKPIYMLPQFCDGRFPNAVPNRLDEMVSVFGRYFTSSIGFQLAYALLEGYEWIGMFGIDLASDVEYIHQRPNAEHLIGIAKGVGRTVYIAPSSALLKSSYVYGHEKEPSRVGNIKDVLTKNKASLNEKRDQTIATLNTLDGAIQQCENVLKFLEYSERGCQIATF